VVWGLGAICAVALLMTLTALNTFPILPLASMGVIVLAAVMLLAMTVGLLQRHAWSWGLLLVCLECALGALGIYAAMMGSFFTGLAQSGMGSVVGMAIASLIGMVVYALPLFFGRYAACLPPSLDWCGIDPVHGAGRERCGRWVIGGIVLVAFAVTLVWTASTGGKGFGMITTTTFPTGMVNTPVESPEQPPVVGE
ncbi:MAG: hypothetical protein ABI743_01690, partial [bacterium]